ncbi:MAG: hypothetical protein JRM99_04475 [Nitrososphaerota archaeon]|nr:hypothetical protein [Nitrososphaerota archaeon]
MVNVTVSMSEETARKLRKVVRELYGSRKGALSSLVEGAVREAIARQTSQGKTSFRAIRDGKVFATADDLEELALIIRNKGIEPRGIRIESSVPLKPVVRVGARGRAA